MNVRVRLAAASAALSLIAIACTGEATDASSVPEEPVTITLLTHDSFDVSKEVVDTFERSSGITLKIVPAGDAGQLVNRAILSAGNPEGDVLFGVDDNLFPKAIEAGVFDTYRPAALDQVGPAIVLDPTDHVVPIDHGEVCLNIDRAWFADHRIEPPAGLEDLTSPTYRGLTVVENPATSTPGLSFLLATVARFGDPGFETFWTQLRANDVRVVDGWEQAYYGGFSGAGGGEGDRPIVVSYASSPVAEVVFAEETLDEAPTAVVTDGCYRQVEFAGVLAGTDHPAEAREVVDFLLSPDFQEDLPLRMFVYPVVEGTALPEVFERFGATVNDPLSMPPEDVAEHRADWVQRWTDLMLA
ncbi:MAG TPA: thiamine ABC transporter substrate-binding protein [Actinomycetota bacterium]